MGSSEACYLGGLALKKRWQAARRAAGKPADRPNIVVSHIAQVCWQKVRGGGAGSGGGGGGQLQRATCRGS